ncbi:hypothetical protein DPMN_098244 [Dreissena polymorpha]|nr:hypothetical protein DPMN_098244 [Dreissena polymorpha]
MHKKKSSERKKLAKRSPSLSDSGADGHFQEVMFAAPNPAYSYFVEQIPQRHHSKRSDPTRETYPQQNGRERQNGQQKDGKRPRQRRDDGEREDFVDFSRNTYS